MKILMQIGMIFGLYWISECVEAILPFPFPASVISMLLLLALMLLKIVKMEHIREKTDFVLANLTFFFVPAAASLMNYGDLIMENAVAFLVICGVSTILTFWATATAVRVTRRLMKKGGDQA